jgi:hypothetical protein
MVLDYKQGVAGVATDLKEKTTELYGGSEKGYLFKPKGKLLTCSHICDRSGERDPFSVLEEEPVVMVLKPAEELLKQARLTRRARIIT